MREFTVQAHDGEQRLSKYLQKILPTIPQSMLYKWIRTNHIKVNHKRCTPEQHVQPGDTIYIYVDDHYFTEAQEHATQKTQTYMQAPAQLDIVYEDAQILLVNKPVGLVVHCDNRGVADTLINRVLHYLALSQPSNATSQTFTPALCNRLDRNTGGLVIAAKTNEALQEMNQCIRKNQVEKTYLCTVVGCLSPGKREVLHGWHKKSSTHNMVEIRDQAAEGFQSITTEYQVLDTTNKYSLLAVHLITGRTHQIRAHLAHIGYPILGDNKYGNTQANRRAQCPYQQLWAYQIKFHIEPDSVLSYLNEKIFCTDLPEFVITEFPNYEKDIIQWT